MSDIENTKEQIDVSVLKQQAEEWAMQNIGKQFQFRKGQLESIVYTLNNILNRNIETSVLQMPTGSGKSLTCIIAAGVLAKYYNMKSYILASDLYLWQQYADAIDKYHLRQFGYMKGSIGNYWCSMSHCDYMTGKCRMSKVGFAQMRQREWRENNGYECGNACQYVQSRIRAERAPVSLLTYQLWLYQMNLVEHSDALGFLPRKVIFCDECHNIPDIVQMYAQPLIDPVNDRNKIQHIIDYCINIGNSVPFAPEIYRPDALHDMYECGGMPQNAIKIEDVIRTDYVLKQFDYFIDCLHISTKYDTRHEIKFDIINDFHPVIKAVAKLAEEALDRMKEQPANELADLTKKEQKERQSDFKILSWVHNYESMIGEFLNSMCSTGPEYVVVEENKDRVTGNVTYSLSCVKEDYLCHNYLMKHSPYKVMLSATVGNKQQFRDSVGIKYSEDNGTYEFTDIPSSFDFSKSPIYFMQRYKMSYQKKREDFPKIQQVIYRILSSPRFADKHGMINTGSYENAREIFNNAPEEIKARLCMYTTSKDKNDVIKFYKRKKNNVIIGPTLIEGVDLPDDYCRFIIIVKVPYPNISSRSVELKKELFPLWYESVTSNSIIQNIGRGVRNENDYCDTFILDGCFQRLYESTRDQFPIEIQQRIKYI